MRLRQFASTLRQAEPSVSVEWYTCDAGKAGLSLTSVCAVGGFTAPSYHFPNTGSRDKPRMVEIS